MAADANLNKKKEIGGVGPYFLSLISFLLYQQQFVFIKGKDLDATEKTFKQKTSGNLECIINTIRISA